MRFINNQSFLRHSVSVSSSRIFQLSHTQYPNKNRTINTSSSIVGGTRGSNVLLSSLFPATMRRMTTHSSSPFSPNHLLSVHQRYSRSVHTNNTTDKPNHDAASTGTEGSYAPGGSSSSTSSIASSPSSLPQNSNKILLSKQDDQPTNIVSYDKYGFNVNGIHMRGSILAFNNFTLLWNMQYNVAITPRSLAIVHMIHPKPQILLIGTGDKQMNVNPALYGYFSRKGIAVEAMTNMHAISTFNVLVAEGRPVCAALVSQDPVSRDDACLYTPDAHLMETEQDRKIIETLAQDLLPQDRDKLLTDGKNDNNIHTPTAKKSSSSLSSNESSLSSSTSIKRKVDVQSEVIATKYGYPGALPPDISPVQKHNNDEDAENIRERVRANRADRRSSTKK